jgi:hypothetical protein
VKVTSAVPGPKRARWDRRTWIPVIAVVCLGLAALVRVLAVVNAGPDSSSLAGLIITVPLLILLWFGVIAWGDRRVRRAQARFGPDAWVSKVGLSQLHDGRRTLVLDKSGVHLLDLDGQLGEQWPWAAVSSAELADIRPKGAAKGYVGLLISFVDRSTCELGVAAPGSLWYTRSAAEQTIHELRAHLAPATR